jgi:hypothetical protein
MNHQEFRVFLRKYPQATEGVIGTENIQEGYKKIFSNVGFREVLGCEGMQDVVDELASFIARKYADEA